MVPNYQYMMLTNWNHFGPIWTYLDHFGLETKLIIAFPFLKCGNNFVHSLLIPEFRE